MNRLAAVRAGYGAILLLAPDRVYHRVTGHGPDRTTRVVMRILGARHLVQAALSIGASSRVLQELGVAVDALHSLSMLGLAALSPTHRREGLTDAVVAGCFGAAGALLTTGTPLPQSPARRALQVDLPTCARTQAVGSPRSSTWTARSGTGRKDGGG